MNIIFLTPIVLITSVTCFDQERKYWRTCIDDTHCPSPFVCWKSRCVCPIGRLWRKPFCEKFSDYNCLKEFYPSDIYCRDVDENRMCDPVSKKCVCRNQTVEDSNDGLCKLIQDTKCKSDQECQKQDNNTMCDQIDGRCKCLSGFYYDFDQKQCQPKLGYKQDCFFSYQCLDSFFCHKYRYYPGVPIIQSGYCSCPIGYRWHANACHPTTLILNCTIDDDCQDSTIKDIENMICVNRTCQCRPGYRIDSTGRCTVEVSHLDGCYLDSDCQANMTCDYLYYYFYKARCYCDYGYQWSKEERKCLLFKDTRCKDYSDCMDKNYGNLACHNEKCVCIDSRYNQTELGFCQMKLMNSCRSNDDCCWSSYCNNDLSRNRCTCGQTQKLLPDGSYCIYKRCNDEHPCHSDDYSNDDNMYCTDYGYCECKHAFNIITGRCSDPPVALTSSPTRIPTSTTYNYQLITTLKSTTTTYTPSTPDGFLILGLSQDAFYFIASIVLFLFLLLLIIFLFAQRYSFLKLKKKSLANCECSNATTIDRTDGNARADSENNLVAGQSQFDPKQDQPPKYDELNHSRPPAYEQVIKLK